MPRFVVFQPPRSSATPISFENFIGITKGLPISSAATSTEDSRGPDFLELGLNQAFNLRLQADGDTLVVSLVSTLNPGEFAPLRLEIIGANESVTAELLEQRLHHLRQVYAITLLIDGGRESDVARVLRDQPLADLEHDLVSNDDKLVILDASPGSLVLSLIANSKKVYRALLYTCAVPFAKGREALLGKLIAGTALAELEVKAKAQDLRFKGAHEVIDLARKIEAIKDVDTRDLIRKRLLADMAGLTSTEALPSERRAINHNPTLIKSLSDSNDLPQPEPVQLQDKPRSKPKREKRS